MRNWVKAVFAASTFMVLSSTMVLAEVVCNEEGDCWRVQERREYKPELKLRIFPSDWRWSDNDKDRYRWRDAPPNKRGGYWRQGVWIDIE